MKKTLHTVLCIKGELIRCHIQYDGYLLSNYTLKKPLVYSVWADKLLYRFLMPTHSTQSNVILHIEKECKVEIPTSFSFDTDGYKISNFRKKMYSNL